MDFDRIHKVFTDYVNTFDMNDKNISLKYYHTLEVSDICYKIASSLGLNEEQKELAKLIGYLHDIGRFEQLAKTNSFKDSIMDHADNGVKLLFEEGLIRSFIEDDKYDEILEKAVRNHNKLEIIDLVTDREKLFCNIIRDADKIDIFRVRRVFYNNDLMENISGEIVTCFEEERPIKIKDVKTKSDSILCVLAFVFDLNYEESIKILNETGYYRELINSMEASKENLEIFNKIKKKVYRKLDI